MAPRTYDGTDISITFDMKRCIHARNCFLKLPQVFDPAQRPWVQPDNASAEEIAAMIRTCPSGALTYQATAPETAPGVNRVSVMENGPLAVAGDLDIEGTPALRATLCRCGLSKTKPYCDYSHVDAGFTATGEPAQKDDDKSDARGGTVQASRAPDGPLVLTGAVEITTGTGRHVTTTQKAFLCRCGASKNKPFCDGSHKAAGFADQPE